MSNNCQPGGLRLYQAIGPQQLEVLIRADRRCIEPGRSGERFCLLKVEQRYAEMIARQSLLPLYGCAYVARLELPPEALEAFPLESIAYEEHLEYRVPRSALGDLARVLLGRVQIVSVFREQHSYSVPAGATLPATIAG
jgi:hypothetical protein